MRSAYSTFYDTQNSNETVHYGIQYTPAYYEEETVIHEYMQPKNLEKPKISKEECHNFPVKINERRAITIDLPPLLWHGYDSTPKILNITNTGRTILINGHWSAGRPYIAGGPLNGNYIFSQVHFHTPSEHEFEGRRYPLEMHVVHYKSSYLTQERAMNEKDGTVVLVYLFEVLDTNPTAMSSVTKLAPQIEKVNSRTETNEVALEQIVQPFTSNYYIYYGSVSSNKNSYLLQWIISGCILCVTSKEADDLLGVMNFDGKPTNLPRMKPQDDVLYYVEEVKFESKPDEMEVLPEPSEEEYSGKVADVPTLDPAILGNLQQQIRDELLQQLRTEITEQINNCLLHQAQSSGVCSDTGTQKSSKSARSSLLFRSNKEKRTTFKKTKDGKVCESEAESRKSKEKFKGSDKRAWKKKCKVEDEDSCTSCIDSSPKESKSESCQTKCETKYLSKCETKCKKKKKNKKKKKKKKKECEEEKEEPSSCSEISEQECKPDCSCESCVSKSEKTKNWSLCKKNESSCDTDTDKDTERDTDRDTEDDSCSSKTKKKTQSKSSMKKSEKSSEECMSDKEKKRKKERQERKEKREMREKERQERKEKREKERQERKEKKEKERQERKEKKEKEKQERKEKKEKKEKKKKDEDCETVCAVATVTDLTFDDILNNYESNWLKESNIPEYTTTESSTNAKTSTAADNLSNSDCSTDIRTLFEKKRNSKIQTLSNHDAFMSFIIPDNINKTYSLIMTQKELDDLKYLISRAKQKGSKNFKQEKEISDDSLKEFCVQVEVLFRSNSEGFSGCAVQEFNLTLLYNQNVLQEYKGLIHPNKLELGNYETLNLLPTYPEMGCITTQLQNCTIKMETLDQICMRAKFLLSALGPFDSRKEDKSTDVLKNIYLESTEAETQCSRAEISKGDSSEGTVTLDTSFVLNPPVIQDPAELNVTINCKSLTSVCSSKVTKSNTSCTNKLEGRKSFNGECKAELLEKSETDLLEDKNNTQQQSTDSCKEEKTDKDSSKNPDKELKCIFPTRKKAAFFMCEKIEVDKKTGKRIFVGNFRTKDGSYKKSSGAFSKIKSEMWDLPATLTDTGEVKRLYKEKSKNTKKGDKLLLFPENSSMKELFRFQKPDKDPKINSLDNTSPNSSKLSGSTSHTLLTLNNSVNKNVGLNCFIKDRYNMVVGKPMQLEKTSSSFKRLVNLVGMDSSKCTNISVYELQNSKESAVQPATSEALSASTRAEIDAGNPGVLPSILSIPSEPSENLNDPDTAYTVESSKNDEAQTTTDKGLLKIDNKSALLIIPIEVESMSKIEVVLIEHKKNLKKAIKASNSEIIPCLAYNETGNF